MSLERTVPSEFRELDIGGPVTPLSFRSWWQTVSKLLFLSPLPPRVTCQPSLHHVTRACLCTVAKPGSRTLATQQQRCSRGAGEPGMFAEWIHTWFSSLPSLSFPWRAQKPAVHGLLPQSLGGTKASHRPPTPTRPYPRLPWGTWEQALALRQRMPCVPAHRAGAHSIVP